mmetsp:Transcript_50555/g.109087  ORF Transcript_50555/g.109087 Transcript_50555/m.109087 type:complete len:291 (-) Transcript_50555:247-1119(-)
MRFVETVCLRHQALESVNAVCDTSHLTCTVFMKLIDREMCSLQGCLEFGGAALVLFDLQPVEVAMLLGVPPCLLGLTLGMSHSLCVAGMLLAVPTIVCDRFGEEAFEVGRSRLLPCPCRSELRECLPMLSPFAPRERGALALVAGGLFAPLEFSSQLLHLAALVRQTLLRGLSSGGLLLCVPTKLRTRRLARCEPSLAGGVLLCQPPDFTQRPGVLCQQVVLGCRSRPFQALVEVVCASHDLRRPFRRRNVTVQRPCTPTATRCSRAMLAVGSNIPHIMACACRTWGGST